MKQKLNKYLLASAFSALCILLWAIIQNSYYAVGLLIIAIYLFDNRDRLIPAILSLSFFIIIYNPSVVMVESIFFEKLFPDKVTALESMFLSCVITFPIILLPIHFINIYFIKAIIIANSEKDNYNTIKCFPDVICKKHHRKTEQYSFLGFKGIHCRISKKCFPTGDVAPLKLVGLIGKLVDEYEDNGKYYISLWNHYTEKIYDADYDIIEIHDNLDIASHDGTINKIINYFYNELNRYKPISEVEVRLVNNPPISENTKRLLEEKFYKVDYINIMK